MNEINIDSIIRVLHPVPDHQASECPFIKWMGEDLTHCPGIGEYVCLKKTYYHGEYGQNKDYHPCNTNDILHCPTHKKHATEKEMKP